MKQFDMKRFGHTLRWSLTMDKGWFLRTTLSWTVMFTLMYLFFTCFSIVVKAEGYDVCTVLSAATAVATLLLGPSFMFAPMKSRHADQPLLMLPASNLEKYLARYSYWLLLVPCLVAAFLMADLLQFVVNTLIESDGAKLVVNRIVEILDKARKAPDDVPEKEELTLLLVALWLHSCYALGATFFRAHKYNHVLTSVALVLGLMLVGIMQGWPVIGELLDHHSCYCNWLFFGLSVFNFWLSYRLFCRTQVIGKFINI